MKNEQVNQHVTLTVGLPASGKSTWAKECASLRNACGFKTVVLNQDNVRDTLSNGDYSRGTLKWTSKFEDEVRKEFNKDVTGYLLAGCDLVLDNTYLNPKTLRKTLENLAQNFPNVKVTQNRTFLEVPVNECLRRDRARKKAGQRAVGDEVILRMWSEYVLPNVPKPEFLPYAPWAIICDLDGTLANLNGRDPFNASKCDETDTPNRAVLDVLSLFHRVGSHLLFTSGRGNQDRDPTVRFLVKKCNLNDYALLMRAEGDTRHDDIVKKELYETHIKGKYNVQFVFDDRPVVVRLWKELGLPVFNVGNGVEF